MRQQLILAVLACSAMACSAPYFYCGTALSPPSEPVPDLKLDSSNPWRNAAQAEILYRCDVSTQAHSASFEPGVRDLRLAWQMLGIGVQFLDQHALSEAGYYLWEAVRVGDAANASPLQRILVRQRAMKNLERIASERAQPVWQSLLSLDGAMLLAYANSPAVIRFHKKFHDNLNALREQHEAAAAAQAAAERAEMFKAMAMGAAIGLQNAGSKDPMAGVRMEQQKQQYVQQATANMERVDAQTAKAQGAIVNALNELKMLSASDLVEVQAGRPFIGAEIGYILAQPDCDTRCIQPVEAFAATRPRVKAAVAAFKQAEGEGVKPALKELAESIQEVEVWAAKNERMGKVAAGGRQ